MALPLVAGAIKAGKAVAGYVAKKAAARTAVVKAKPIQMNVAKNSKSAPKGVSKATDAVKKQRGASKGTDSKAQLEAKAKRTKSALGREQTARRKAGEGSAARTKTQQKADKMKKKGK